MRKVGTFCIRNEEEYFSEDGISFFFDKEKQKPLSIKHIENWAVMINSPWSQSDESYEIKVNCKDGYTKMDPNDPVWVCEYSIVGYDCLTASVLGYGNTPQEALSNCTDLFSSLQREYNKEDKSI